MVEASKLWFDRAAADKACAELIHPWTGSCTTATITMLLNSIKGSYQFYAVLYIIQMLIKGKKLKKDYLIKQFKSYLLSGAFGFLVGTSFVTFNCILRGLFFNRFHYYMTVLFPMTLSGFSIFIEPPYRRYLVVSTFVNLVFEYWVRTLQYKNYIRVTPGRETFIFMVGSAFLFYLMRQEAEKPKGTSLLWFYTPPKVNRSPERIGAEGCQKLKNTSYSVCPHKGPCHTYILKGTTKMFALGCAMTFLRTLLPKIATPWKALKSLKLKDCSLGAFLGGYIGIYTFVTCLLCRHYGKDSEMYALPGGLLAGSAFWFHPSLPISLATITSILQILCSRLYENKMIPDNLPIGEVIYALCQGLLFHARVMHPEMCPRYILNLMKTVTNGKANEIQDSFVKILSKTC